MFEFKKISDEEYRELQSKKTIGGSRLPDYVWSENVIKRERGEQDEDTSEALVIGDLLHKIAIESFDVNTIQVGSTKNFSSIKWNKNNELPQKNIDDLKMYKNMIEKSYIKELLDVSIEKEVGYLCVSTDIPIRCKFDFVTESEDIITIHDLKTTSKRPPQTEKDLHYMFDDYSYDHQIMLYGWCASKIYNKQVNIVFHFVHKNGLLSSISRVDCSSFVFYTDNDILEMVRIAEQNYKYVKNGSFVFAAVRSFDFNKNMFMEVA